MISIDPGTFVVTIPQSDLTLVSGSLYELDVDWLRLQLKDFEDGEIGMAMPVTHRHNTTVTLSGVTYARTFEVLAPYTVTFEDVGTPYAVRCVGANHNLADVKNVNSVSLIIGNSAGLIVTGGGAAPTASQIADAVWDEAASGHVAAGSIGLALLELYRLAGLDPTKPLVVTATSRDAGAGISQTVAEAPAGTVTVTRT